MKMEEEEEKRKNQLERNKSMSEDPNALPGLKPSQNEWLELEKNKSMSEDPNALPGLKPSQNEWSELEKNKSMSEDPNALPGLKPSQNEWSGLQTLKINPQQEIAQMQKENRKFTILQRERAMNDAQRAKNRSAILAGVCILGAATAVYFNGQDMQQVLQHELNAIYSWEALGQYLQDLGPITTLLAAGAGGFIAKYFKNSKKFKQAQNELIDFNASLENVNTNELGGNENAKSR